MNENENDEQFYRDTEAIAFPKLDDRQLAMLAPLGERRVVRRGEILFKAGQRDLGMTVILSGGLEAFETRDGSELILATPGPRDFVGEIAMLTGNATLVSVRGKEELSEVLIIGAAELRRALSELPGLGEIIVSALMMRRKRLQRDREFSGFRIVAMAGSRDGRQLDDFLDKNHVPHRLIDFETDEGRELCRRLNVNPRDLPVLIQANGFPLRRPSLREVAQVAGLLRSLVRDGETEVLCDLVIVGAGPAGTGGCRLRGIRRLEDRGARELRARWPGGRLVADRKLLWFSHRYRRR